jgi:3-oxoacyl-[acyl-carrier protein] reductase
VGISYPRFDGRVALVTGGRRGIGRGIARRLAAQGASVVISVMSPSESFVAETVEIFAREGKKLALVEGDLSNPSSRADMISRASSHFGPIDILVNNAAVNPRTLPSAMTLADRRMMFEVNLHGPVDLIQQSLPGMRERRWGRVLNVLSESIRQTPIPYAGPAVYTHSTVVYGASKAALERYTKGLALELEGSGVQVNGIYPYRVCVTEENSEAARAALRIKPELAEGIETMAEAAMLLIAGPMSGVSASSRQILLSFQQPLLALDGHTVIGDANTLPNLS